MTDALASQRLAALGIELGPTRTVPAGNYVNVVEYEGLLLVSGHGPLLDGVPVVTGRVPSQVTVEQAIEASRLAALNCLSSLAEHLGSIDRVGRVLRIFGMVNADVDFQQHARVLDGASDLVAAVFADRGVHVRAAVGMSSLPFNIPVELEMTAVVRSSR